MLTQMQKFAIPPEIKGRISAGILNAERSKRIMHKISVSDDSVCRFILSEKLYCLCLGKFKVPG